MTESVSQAQPTPGTGSSGDSGGPNPTGGAGGTEDSTAGGSKPSPGVIAGVVVACVAVIAAFCIVVYFLMRKVRRAKAAAAAAANSTPLPDLQGKPELAGNAIAGSPHPASPPSSMLKPGSPSSGGPPSPFTQWSELQGQAPAYPPPNHSNELQGLSLIHI